MKKIVFLHPANWEQDMGGAELQISYLVKYFSSSGFEVHFIFEDRGKQIENNENIILHPIKKIMIKKIFGAIWFLYFFKIKRELIKIKPDFIYTRFYSSWSGMAASYAIKNNIHHLWALASDKDVRHGYNFKMLIKPFDFIEYLIVKRTFKNATTIITQNNFQTLELLRRYNRIGVKILQMGKLVNLKSLNKPDNVINIIWIANLKPIKRPKLFIQLARRFNDDENIKFIMIGKSRKIYNKLLDYAKRELKNFSYLGELCNQQINKQLYNTHILINTSEFEGFSNTFVQAWMSKVVVLTMKSNPDEILTKQKIGFVESSIERMDKRLRDLLKNRQSLKMMSEKSYEYCILNHNYEENAKKILELLHN